MPKTKLHIVEDRCHQNKAFSAQEIKELLQKDGNGEYPNLQKFFDEYKDLIEQQYGTENPLIALRRDLQERSANIELLLYYKKLEEGLSGKIQARLDNQKNNTRSQIQSLLQHNTTLDPEALRELRSSDSAHFYSMNFRVDDQFVNDYIDLVRYEMKEHLKIVQQLDQEKTMEEQPEKLENLYRNTESLVDFVMEHIPENVGNRQFVKAYVLKVLRSDKGAELIEDLYQKVAEALNEEDAQVCRQKVQQVATRLHALSTVDRKQHLLDVCQMHLAELDLTEEEISEMLTATQYRNRITGEILETYPTDHDGIALHKNVGRNLEEIEQVAFDDVLYSFTEKNGREQETEVNTRIKKAYQDYLDERLNTAKAELKEKVLQFRDQFYSVDTVVDGLGWLDENTSEKLKKAVKARFEIEENTSNKGYRAQAKQILDPIRGFESGAEVQAYLTNSESAVREKFLSHIDPQLVDQILSTGQQDVYELVAYVQKQENLVEIHESLRKNCIPSQEVAGSDHFSKGIKTAQSHMQAMAYSGKLNNASVADWKDQIANANIGEAAKKELEAQLDHFWSILSNPLPDFFEDVTQAQECVAVLAGARRIDDAAMQSLRAAIAKSPFDQDDQSALYEKLRSAALEFKRAHAIDTAEKKTGEETSPIIKKEEVLKEARQLMTKMEEFTQRQFAHPGDIQAFDTLKNSLDRLLKKQIYLAHETVEGPNGERIYTEGKKISRTRYRQQRLPVVEQIRLESIQHLRHQDGKYEHLQELKAKEFFLKDVNLSSPQKIREGIEAVFGGYFRLNKGKTSLKKLSQVMSLDHPLTTLRFEASSQEPFLHEGRYQFHRLPGQNEPATFTERSQDLLREVKKLVMAGNFAEIDKLMKSGGIGYRLYADASFFPYKKLKEPDVCHEYFFRWERTEKTTKDGYIEEAVIDENRIGAGRDRAYIEKASEKMKNEFRFDSALGILSHSDSDSLVENQEFMRDFGYGSREEIEQMKQVAQCVVLNEDGTVNKQETEARIAEYSAGGIEALHEHMVRGGEVKSLGIFGDAKIPEETIEGFMKDYPRIAGSMMQFNNFYVGGAWGATEMAARWGYDTTKMWMYQAPVEMLKKSWKGLKGYSPMQVWHAIDQMVEHIRNLSDFYMKIGSYELLQTVFNGTLIGNEFTKLYQAEEDKRVNEFKSAFEDFGQEQVIEKIYTATDEFELKAALMEGFESRGIITNEHLLDRRFFRNLNRFTPTVTVPLNHTEDEMLNDEEVQFKMLDHLRYAIDDIWGTGTWQSWRSAGANKYDSVRQEALNNVKGYSSADKWRTYQQYWEYLKTDDGIGKLKAMHPGEIVGTIESDFEQGDLDSGQTYAIMQALICKGIVRLDHVRRLHGEHANNMPINSLLEPKQAYHAGLTKIVENLLAEKKPYEEGKNDLIEFYQGKKALPLKAKRHKGKWRFPSSKDDAQEEVLITVHQIQKNREAQPEFHRKMDNSCIGIFSPAYNWNQIASAMDPNTQGNIDARAHDIVAAYRGIHYEFGAYMEAMGSTELMKPKKPEEREQKILNFKRQIWHAYDALCKTQAYGSFLARHVTRDNDYTYNTLDGSPNIDIKHKEERATGETNFQRLILGVSGPHQRMGQSSEHLDNIEMDPKLRRSYKEMAGYQYVSSLGVNPDTGLEDDNHTENYSIRDYDPVKQWQKTVPLFVKNVINMAYQHGYGQEIEASLEASGMADIKPGNNNERIRKLTNWVNRDLKMP